MILKGHPWMAVYGNPRRENEDTMLAIRRCRYCGELFDVEVGDSDQYCENCQQIMDMMAEDEDHAGLALEENKAGTYCEEFLGLAIPEAEVEDVGIPDSVFDLAASIDFQIEKGRPVSEKPIDDFQTGAKGTRRNAKSIFRAPKERMKR